MNEMYGAPDMGAEENSGDFDMESDFAEDFNFFPSEDDAENSSADFSPDDEETEDNYRRNTDGDWPENWEDERPEVDEKFTLRHLGVTREVGRDEALSLAQKGLDYDRIRRERDMMRPRLEGLEQLLSALSEKSGMDGAQLLRKTRAAAIIRAAEEKGESLSEDEAMELAGEDSPYNPEHAEEMRRRESILAFAQRFPDVPADEIPQAVWQDFLAGGELSSLYAMEENGRLRRRVSQLEQREKNHFRSTRSRRSAGERPSLSFEELWNSGD